MSKQGHTPTPWVAIDKYVQFGDTGTTQDLLICKCVDNPIKNATFIVKAVNCHDELVEALKNIATRSEGNDQFTASDVNNLAKFVLAKVGEA